MTPEPVEQPQQVQIEVDEITAQGVYANLGVISHSENEFIFDFIFIQPQVPKGKVRSRIITSPQHAKRFMLALQENVRKYEEQFGEMRPDADRVNPRIGFAH
jgi:hypothetical protein